MTTNDNMLYYNCRDTATVHKYKRTQTAYKILKVAKVNVWMQIVQTISSKYYTS